MTARLLQKMQRLLFLFHAKAAYFHTARLKLCDYIHGGHHIKKNEVNIMEYTAGKGTTALGM